MSPLSLTLATMGDRPPRQLASGCRPVSILARTRENHSESRERGTDGRSTLNPQRRDDDVDSATSIEDRGQRTGWLPPRLSCSPSAHDREPPTIPGAIGYSTATRGGRDRRWSATSTSSLFWQHVRNCQVLPAPAVGTSPGMLGIGGSLTTVRCGRHVCPVSRLTPVCPHRCAVA